MKQYRYNNAIINISGEVDRDKIEEATIIFLKKADKCRKNKMKEKNQNGNDKRRNN